MLRKTINRVLLPISLAILAACGGGGGGGGNTSSLTGVVAVGAALPYTAVKIVDGMRVLGLIVPAKKWAAKLQGTLRTGGFSGFALKAEDQSVWSVDVELLDKTIQAGGEVKEK